MRSNNATNNHAVRNKILSGLLITIICMLAAFGMCMSYGIIEKTAVDKNYNYFETSDFQTDLLRSCYAVAYEMVKDSGDTVFRKPSDVYFGELNQEYVEYRKDRFDEQVDYWTESLNVQNYNLKYYGKMGDKVVGNEEALAKADIDKVNYQFYVKMEFDKDGILTVSGLKGADKMHFSRSGYVNWMQNQMRYTFNPIKDASFVFAVPVQLNGEDSIAAGIRDQDSFKYMESTIVVAGLWILLILIVALLFPYSFAKDLAVLKLPFILWCLIVFAGVGVVNVFAHFGVGQSILHNQIEIGTFIVTHHMIMLGNLLIWFGVFLAAFLTVLEIKSIFIIGVKTYFSKRTISGNVIGYLIKGTKQTIKYVEHIDLREKNNKYIMKLLGINAVILFVITSIWFAGIPVVIVYTIVLYFVIKKYVDIISENYRTLTEATNQIAEGDLDVTIEEDLGVFNPFKDNLEKIQGGFKKAVQEEVKSQKMKTDLISNVSHDLKTPLTAIVTYTDLLQDTSLPEEKRKEYLQVLDRKAQRLQVLIEDLFEMSKVSSGTIQLDLEEVDVVSLMKQTLIEVEDQLEKSALTVKTSFSSEHIMKQLDSERMYRVFENLLLNASKYAMKNTRVYVDIIEEEKNVTITVKNISAEEMTFNEQEIVERFIRGDKSRNTEGSGLGLAIVKSFVELQGGKFHIEMDGDLFKAIITL